MSKKILVTGANGTIGSALVRQLQAGQIPFVAAVRDTAKAAGAALSSDQILAFDFADEATYEPATRGVEAVFLLGPPATLEVDKLLFPFIEHLKAQGIRRVVYVSALGEEKMGGELDFHSKITTKLAADGFDLTILKPSFFAQNFRTYEWENITQRGITYVTAGSGKVAFVDVEDIAAVAVTALTQEGHSGKTYRITGPEALSYSDAAQLLSEVAGKPIMYPNPSPEEYTAALKAAGAPDYVAPYMIAVYSLIARNEADLVTNDVLQVTRHQPTPLRQVLERDFA